MELLTQTAPSFKQPKRRKGSQEKRPVTTFNWKNTLVEILKSNIKENPNDEELKIVREEANRYYSAIGSNKYKYIIH